jgi:hypothetical protein
MGGILKQTQMRRADGTPSKITAADAFAGLPGFLGAAGRNAGGVFANVASMASEASLGAPVSTAATGEQKRAAAKRRVRGIQQRSLLSGARGGAADTGEQTTLGVG